MISEWNIFRIVDFDLFQKRSTGHWQRTNGQLKIECHSTPNRVNRIEDFQLKKNLFDRLQIIFQRGYLLIMVNDRDHWEMWFDQLEGINCKLPIVSILIKCVNNTDKGCIDELD